MDALEKYVRDQQAEFERIDSVDADALWSRIQAPVTAPARPSGWQVHIGRYWRWSAAAILILATGMGLWWSSGRSSSKAPSAAISDYYPQLAAAELTYRRSIALKEAELDIDRLNRQQFIDIFAELDELERLHRQQLQDLPQVFHDEDWVRTLLRYYERKVRILERLGHEIEKDQHLKNKSRARSS